MKVCRGTANIRLFISVLINLVGLRNNYTHTTNFLHDQRTRTDGTENDFGGCNRRIVNVYDRGAAVVLSFVTRPLHDLVSTSRKNMLLLGWNRKHCGGRADACCSLPRPLCDLRADYMAFGDTELAGEIAASRIQHMKRHEAR